MSPNQPASSNPFVEFLNLYRDDPVLFVREVLGVEPDGFQADLLRAVAAGDRRISVRSGHGVGKSTVASWAMLWYLLTRLPVKVVVTAPTTAQLFDALFAELKRWVAALPPVLNQLLDVKSDKIELRAAPAECFISARTSRAETPEALQGVHSENVMLVADEASGIPEPVFEAASGSMSGHSAVTLLLGNPVRSSGFFYDTHHKLADQWRTFHVSSLTSPRVSADFVADMASRYGEESNAYRIRVLGEFPRSDDDTLIPMELLELAKSRDVERIVKAPRVWGLDVARFGGDSSVLCERQANWVTEVRTWRQLDLMQLCGAVKHEWDIRHEQDRPEEILVDVIGLGAGVADRLRELGLPARGINVSESPALAGQFTNLRAELWSKAKSWLAARDCRLPDNERLISELATVRYRFTSSGKLQIESKDEMRKRGRGSPDVADAFVLTFASNAAIAAHGGQSWGKALRRNVRGVV